MLSAGSATRGTRIEGDGPSRSCMRDRRSVPPGNASRGCRAVAVVDPRKLDGPAQDRSSMAERAVLQDEALAVLGEQPDQKQ